ncbi:MAG: nucleotidyltransferase domain-containing protein [Clostridium sp.]|nr:nucleotidyltransferase domain-containing protein [Clostridium sp.]
MNKESLMKKLNNIHGIVAISQFGSYGTEYWIKDRSDIDLAVITEPNITYMETLNMEDELINIFKEHYGYEYIHLTFILFKEFYSKYARIAVDSDNIFIVDEDRWFDFQHYVLKHARNNREFEKRLKIDEQYTYFGGIIDESIL